MGKLRNALFVLVLMMAIPSSAFSAPSLQWEASTGEVDGYRIYYGTSHGNFFMNKDVGNRTLYSLSALSLQRGTTYYFVVAAYNGAGESDPSNEVSWTVPADSTPPAPPQGLTGFLNDKGVVVLSWRANSESDLGGYRVYYGTSSRVYGSSQQIGNQTVCTLAGLEGGKTYYFAVTAEDTSGNESGYSVEWRQNIQAPDTVAPSVRISSPTTADTYTSNNPSISLGGMASDNIGVTIVTWINSTGASGTASGTTSWHITGIPLVQGNNVITVTAQDASGNKASRSLTVRYLMSTDTIPPSVTIMHPTTSHYYVCQSPTLDLSGNASDNVEVQTVSWWYASPYTSLIGAATGTSSWSISGIPLSSGWNYIVVNALDSCGNRGSAPLWVYRQ